MNTTRRGAVVRSIAFACATVAAGTASAEGPNDRFWGQLEYFFPTIDSTARLDFPGTNLPGTQVRLEDDLGLDDRKGVPYLLLGTRFGQDWRLEFEYYRLERKADRTIDRDISWGDINFPVSAQLSSEFNSTVYRLTGGYSFLHTPQYELGGSFGLHVTDFKLGLSGQGNGGAGLGFQREERDQLVPLPTLGLYGNWQVAEQWVLRGRVDFLSFKYDEYDGRLINLMAGADWRFTKNWGLGVGYRYVDYRVSSTDVDFHGEVKYEFRGPTVYLTAAF
jgi:hypothetical protein